MTTRTFFMAACLLLAWRGLAAQDRAPGPKQDPRRPMDFFLQKESQGTDPGLIGKDGIAVERTRLSPSAEEGLIDKCKIAAETMQRLQTYREAGNPHIREGLLLASIQEDPALTKIDSQKLHQDMEQIVERRVLPGESSASEVTLRPLSASENDRSSPAKVQCAPASSSGTLDIVLAVTGVSLACGCALFLALKR